MNMVYIHHRTLFSGVKKNEIMGFVGEWMKVKKIILTGPRRRTRVANGLSSQLIDQVFRCECSSCSQLQKAGKEKEAIVGVGGAGEQYRGD